MPCNTLPSLVSSHIQKHLQGMKLSHWFETAVWKVKVHYWVLFLSLVTSDSCCGYINLLNTYKRLPNRHSPHS